ncbi:hypothetical protein H4219_002542 [Mycoemilia scoparia]|uniref:Uncharacterized protein n=1 Tax=Mycoemilia scoparia TaxID=417184 RepID=A0A9W8A0Y0_9FUNG|nr:hypothetical protein H4219_002542 [Mycoemilia scoparia]
MLQQPASKETLKQAVDMILSETMNVVNTLIPIPMPSTTLSLPTSSEARMPSTISTTKDLFDAVIGIIFDENEENVSGDVGKYQVKYYRNHKTVTASTSAAVGMGGDGGELDWNQFDTAIMRSSTSSENVITPQSLLEKYIQHNQQVFEFIERKFVENGTNPNGDDIDCDHSFVKFLFPIQTNTLAMVSFVAICDVVLERFMRCGNSNSEVEGSTAVATMYYSKLFLVALLAVAASSHVADAAQLATGGSGVASPHAKRNSNGIMIAKRQEIEPEPHPNPEPQPNPEPEPHPELEV